MRDVLRSMVFLGRNLAADLLARASHRVRAREDRPEWLKQVVVDIEHADKKPGDVTLSPLAERMRDEAAQPPPEYEDEHTPPEPLRGSLAWRQRYGDSRR